MTTQVAQTIQRKVYDNGIDWPYNPNYDESSSWRYLTHHSDRMKAISYWTRYHAERMARLG